MRRLLGCRLFGPDDLFSPRRPRIPSLGSGVILLGQIHLWLAHMYARPVGARLLPRRGTAAKLRVQTPV
jgi:hypothetical protein